MTVTIGLKKKEILDKVHAITCKECGGKGEIKTSLPIRVLANKKKIKTESEEIQLSSDCSICNGEGKIFKKGRIVKRIIKG